VNFEFLAPTRILFGSGRRQELKELLPGPQQKLLIVTGSVPDRYWDLLGPLEAAHALMVVSVRGEPSTLEAEEATTKARAFGATRVIAIGGGSAIDLAKAVAALVPQPEGLASYLEVVGAGKPLHRPALPLFAIPTTAGTGAEVTRNAVLTDKATRVKASLRHRSMLPELALVDPELAITVGPAVTAATGLDALTQCLEPFVSHAHTPLTDALGLMGAKLALDHVRQACSEPDSLQAREALATSALCGGIALANSKLGAVHGFAAPLGGELGAPHGAVCARLLGPVIRVNYTKLRATSGGEDGAFRYEELARYLYGSPNAQVNDLAELLEQTANELGIERLAAYGLTRSAFPALIGKAARASSMKGNPVLLSETELEHILELAL